MTADIALPYIYDTTIDMLEAAARRNPGGEAIVCGAERLDYRAYLDCVRAFAAELREHAEPGDRVVLLMGNSIDLAIAILAAQAAGMQATPLNPGYTIGELAPILDDATPAVIVHDRDTGPVLDAALGKVGFRPLVIEIGERRLIEADPARAAVELPVPAVHAIAALQYTGGTTGRSKGVELTHRAICVNIAQREAVLPTLEGEDRILSVAPLFHVYAVTMGIYLAAYCAGTLVLLPRYRPDWTVDALAEERITLFAGNPTIFKGLLAYEGFAEARFPRLRLCYSGAAALPEETLRRWEAATGVAVCEGFGQTEAGPIVTYNPAEGVRKPGSAGPALPGIEVRIVDAGGSGRVLPAGEVGEIVARTPAAMRGYRGLPEATGEALRDGWLHTGDLGCLDEDGYLFVKDRLKDMVVSGGYNVYPREIEELLHAHPAVAEAAVIGVADDYLGEAVRAYVVPREGEDLSVPEIAAYCAENLVKYKRPREIVVVDALPKTAAGKVDKKLIVAEARQEAGASARA